MKIATNARILLFILAGIVLCQNFQCRAQGNSSEKSAANSTVVLEVIATDFDIAWHQKYAYLRVFSTGTAEGQIVKRKGFNKPDITTVKKMLNEPDMQSLRALLAQPEVLRLQTQYKQRIAIVLDAGTSWDIRIPRLDQTQRIQVVAFAPDEAKTRKNPYPDALVKLGCTIDALRATATGEQIEVEEECKKALAAH